jgi:hypothetical protein
MADIDETSEGGAGTSVIATRKQKRPMKKHLKKLCDRYKKLGWREKYIDDYFKNMSECNMDYEVPDYVFLDYAESWFGYAYEDNMGFQTLLYKVGFKKVK